MLFDGLISDFGESIARYLSCDATIVNNSTFEKSIVKVLNNQDLLPIETEALKRLEISCNTIESRYAASDEEKEFDLDYGVQLLKKRRVEIRSPKYIELKDIPVTSNIVERFFSQVKLNLTYLRNNLLPSTLEMIMFLKLNALMLSPLYAQKAMNNISNK